MLKIKNLSCKTEEKEILKKFNLEIKAGEVHIIMGPNGTGKSTLSHILAGKQGYDITEGEIEFLGKNLMELAIDERAKAGLFLAFQYPIEIAGVSGMNFLKSSLNSIKKANGEKELDGVAFLKLVREKAKILNISDAMLKRAVNVGFSGGEKKRFEALQMMVLDPKLIILDEPDSGLDVDALQLIANSINAMKGGDKAICIITHYKRLLNFVEPDFIHIVNEGAIVKTGGMELADKLEAEGYKAF